ncbi:hypothetical protein IE53DRAFT_142097 [Violaceomyces palustris]|uniref:Uncharacterized protein n=1 Tax=Violaceomyces palustris TaxID=1673888 RepID=A0ACD0NUM5_9BASI|nr:hypothetical protein IE53DRAFT_142097 [Violaceomyces palustris]
MPRAPLSPSTSANMDGLVQSLRGVADHTSSTQPTQAKFTTLPLEVLNLILSEPCLGLPDLARLCLVHPSLAPSARLAASRHRCEMILRRHLGFQGKDILSFSDWCNVSTNWSARERPWESFSSSGDILVEDIVSLATFFSMIARWAYTSNAGFPQLVSGSLPGDSLLQSNENFRPMRRPGLYEAHRAFLLACSTVLAATRALTRRVRTAVGRERESAEYAHLNAAQKEERLRQEFVELRAALVRCDPLTTHTERIRSSHAAKRTHTRETWSHGRTVNSTQDCFKWDCACKDATWATWYQVAWDFLTQRYRRFLGPQDIAFISYRSILSSVSAFPTSLSPQKKLPDLHSPPPSTSSSGPLLLSTHLNPDSMLFSMRESATFEQTRAWFGLSEHGRAPGLARLWAGNVGYGWGEGGAMWQESSRMAAEARLSSSVTRAVASTALANGGSTSRPGRPFSLPEPRLRPPYSLSRSLNQSEPIEVVLLCHARWRARTLGRLLDSIGNEVTPADATKKGWEKEVQPNQVEDFRSRQASSFDIHFVRRALQIQQWATEGFAATPGAFGGPSISSSSVQSDGQGEASAPSAAMAGAVHPSTPFSVAQAADDRDGIKASIGRLVSGLASAIWSSSDGVRSDSASNRVARNTDLAWLSIAATIRPFIGFEPPSENAVATKPSTEKLDSNVQAFGQAELCVRKALGNLHEGLLPPASWLASTTRKESDNTCRPGPSSSFAEDRTQGLLLPLCPERSDFMAPAPPVNSRFQKVYISDGTPAGAPNVGPRSPEGILTTNSPSSRGTRLPSILGLRRRSTRDREAEADHHVTYLGSNSTLNPPRRAEESSAFTGEPGRSPSPTLPPPTSSIPFCNRNPSLQTWTGIEPLNELLDDGERDQGWEWRMADQVLAVGGFFTVFTFTLILLGLFSVRGF